jgi:hypothetical protein
MHISGKKVITNPGCSYLFSLKVSGNLLHFTIIENLIVAASFLMCK